MTIYQEQGYTNRKEYLTWLAVDFGLPDETVFLLASLLGESEDFDGLVCACEDVAEKLY